MLTGDGARVVTRTLTSSEPSCASLTRAVVASLALMIDDALEAQPAATPSATVAREQPRRAARRAGGALVLDAEGGVATGLLPSTTSMALAGLSWEGRLAALGVTGWTTPKQSVAYAPGKITLAMSTVGATFCAFPWGKPRRLTASVCAAPTAGLLYAGAQGFDSNRSVLRPWAALALPGRLRGVVAGPLEWSLRIEPLWVLLRQNFSIDRLGQAYRPPAAGLLASAGLSVPIW